MSVKLRFWLVTGAALLGVAVTLALGRWQLGRAAQKEALQASIDARALLPVVDARGLAAAPDSAELLQRRVDAVGQWVPQYSVFLDNRQMNGRAGFFVLTPLRLEGSAAVVLVQRGWVPRSFEERTRVPSLDTPGGAVRVQGRIVPAPSKLYELGDAGTGTIRQNLDVAQFRAETGLALVGVSIQQTGASGDGLARDWPPINAGVDKHYGYAFQWFGLSALIALLYVWFQIVRRYKHRQA